MKIETIFEIISPRVQHRSVSGKFGDTDNDEMGPNLGAYSRVKQGSDPHTIKKSTRTSASSDIDGYWRYVDYIIKYKLWENPHFPRIYNIKSIKDSEDKIMRRGEMEKLIPLNDLRLDEIKQLYQKTFNTRLPNLEKDMQGKSREEVKIKYIRKLASSVSFALTRPNTVEDESFKKAVRILKMIKRKERNTKSKDKIRPAGFIHDLNDGNIMIRRTPYGSQIVFTDPFI